MQELKDEQIHWILGDSGVGVLALASDGDAYAIPIHYARDGNDFYFHSRHGIKEDFIASTKLACLVVVKVESVEDWRSVQVLGKLERLVGSQAKLATEGVLRRIPLPPQWETGDGSRPKRSNTDLFVWRLAGQKMTGRRNMPDDA